MTTGNVVVSQSRLDSQRANTNVPQAAGFRNVKPSEKTNVMQTSVRIRNASVEEYFGDYSSKERGQYPGFKTSKIILQAKN